MKILQINSHYNKGGAGKIVSYLHKQLIENGYESVVVYGRECEECTDPFVFRIGNNLSNYFDAGMTRVTGLTGTHSILCTKQLINIIKEFMPDVIHLHVLHGYYLNFRLLFEFLNTTEIPIVWTFHDCQAFTGKCGYPYTCAKYKFGCGNCELLHDYPNTFFFDCTSSMWKEKKSLFTKSEKKIIISPSKWMTKMAQESFFGKYQCFTINNGIDTTIFTYQNKVKCREELKISNYAMALGVAFGQDNPRKGVKYIIKAAEHLPEIQFVIIGWNKNVPEQKLPNNVIVIPYIKNQKELAKFYSAADVFLIPSLAENYATTAIEALCCGTPVLGFETGGIPEQAYGVYGATVQSGNQMNFENYILKYCKNEILTDDMRKEISKKKSYLNSQEKMFNKYLKVYEMMSK